MKDQRLLATNKPLQIKDISVSILAGGLATRLRPITEKIPKALVEIAGEPFIAHQLRHLSNQGIKRVVLCVGYLGEMVENYVGDGSKFNLNVQYSYDGETLLGTGGAIRKAHHILSDPFFVLYGDSFLPISSRKVLNSYYENQKPNLMTVYKNSGQFDKSNIIYESGRIKKYNKTENLRSMNYIDYGYMILSKSSFANFNPNTKFDLGDLLSVEVQKKRISGFESKKRFYEIGSQEGLNELNKLIQNRKEKGIIILDRDGVLNRMLKNDLNEEDSPMVPEQVEMFSKIPSILNRLKKSSFMLAIATNQPAAAKNKTTYSNLQKVHEKVLGLANIQGTAFLGSYICWHKKEDQCDCRKPAIGLLQDVLSENPGYSLHNSWMVGDRHTDVLAGKKMGLKAALLRSDPYDELRLLEKNKSYPDLILDSLDSFARALEGNSKEAQL